MKHPLIRAILREWQDEYDAALEQFYRGHISLDELRQAEEEKRRVELAAEKLEMRIRKLIEPFDAEHHV